MLDSTDTRKRHSLRVLFALLGLLRAALALPCVLICISVSVLLSNPPSSAAEGAWKSIDTIYIACNYVGVREESETGVLRRKPCFLIHSSDSTGTSIRSWSAIQPRGTDSAVVRIVTDSPAMIEKDNDVVVFGSKAEAIDYAKRVLRYRGQIPW